MKEVDFSYKWFLEVCEKENLVSDSYLVLSELEVAKDLAYQIAHCRETIKKMKITHPQIDWDKKMEVWFKKKDEKRIEHMLLAVEMAEYSTRQGEVFNEIIGIELDKVGIPKPKI